jgi:lysine 6-dehydrogenase
MKLTVIGAGAIGSAVALRLNEREDVTQIRICDARARSLQRLRDETKSPKMRSFQVDVRDVHALEPIIRDSACVIGCATPEINPVLAETCLEQGIHFCDLGGNDEIVHNELKLDERARTKSVWIVPNCGLAPGLINILCLRGIEQFDDVHAAHLRVGDVPLHPEPPFNFRISWSAEKVLEDYTQPVQRIENGRIVLDDPLTMHEHIYFEEPFRRMESFCTAGGLSTLAEQLAGSIETLDHKTIRWPGHADQMRFLLGLGFGENRSIDVRTHLTYRDVLLRRMRQRLSGFYEDAVLLRVLVKGVAAGKEKTLVYEMADRFDAERSMTAMRRSTSVATASVACLLAAGKISGGGAQPPENVVPRDLYGTMLEEQGLHIKTTWYDGHVDVADPSGSFRSLEYC